MILSSFSINLLAFHQYWLRKSLSILLQIVSTQAVYGVSKIATTSLRSPGGVCEEGFDKFLNDQ